jgi:hypothetical protein
MSGKTPAARWTGPADILAQLQRLWDDGRILGARVSGEPLFPLTLRLRQPSLAEMGAQFEAVRDWVRELEAGSQASQGGYAIIWREVNHRQLGRNKVPDQVCIASEADALRLIRRQADARRFGELTQATLLAFPALTAWLARRPMTLLEQADAWSRMLAIVAWFLANPRPQRYLRQLDIAGVDSKFIETRKGLLMEMLDLVLPPSAIDVSAVGARQFEQRYGLLSKPVTIRFRLLDPAMAINGLSDISVPIAQFAQLRLDVERVFITENEINGLALPAAVASMVIFGGGYAIGRLAQIGWLAAKDVLYWGDIDTHGFSILDQLRGYFPHTRSMLMDADTLHAHRLLWGAEAPHQRFMGQLARLTEAEQSLYRALCGDVHGAGIRLEQERIGFECVLAAIEKSNIRHRDVL